MSLLDPNDRRVKDILGSTDMYDDPYSETIVSLRRILRAVTNPSAPYQGTMSDRELFVLDTLLAVVEDPERFADEIRANILTDTND